MHCLIIIVATLIATSVFAERVTYEGCKVVRVYPKDENELGLLAVLAKSCRLDFWSHPHTCGKPVDVMVDPHILGVFVWVLQSRCMKYEIVIEDVESVLQKERDRQSEQAVLAKGSITFAKYNRHDEINAYLDYLAANYFKYVSVETIGRSYEGRELKVIKISRNPNANNPIIFIDAAFHGREWITAAKATYIINQLVENPERANLLDKVDWHILPVVNPDGYEYAHDQERLWTKNRSPTTTKMCYGTDINHNFGLNYGEGVSSENECSNNYRGASDFSELESRALRDYFTKYQNNIKLYLSLHSYGEYLLFPWGPSYYYSDDYSLLQYLGEQFANAISRAYGTVYTVGSEANLLYSAAGRSDEWAKYGVGIELSYTLELYGGGPWGFDPPQSQILKVSQESFVGILTFHTYIEQTYYN